MKWIVGLLVTLAVLVAGALVVISMNQEDPTLPPAPIASATPTPPSPSPSPSETAACSGVALAGTHDHEMAAGLPLAVADTRIRIIEAATSCRYGALGHLATAGEPFFSYSFGDQTGDPAAFWRAREREAKRLGEETSEYLRYLVATLQLPYCEEDGPDGKHYYVWPRVHCSARVDSDWEDLEGLYPDEQIEQMKTGDSFLGFRVGILEDGDWVYFIAGD